MRNLLHRKQNPFTMKTAAVRVIAAVLAMFILASSTAQAATVATNSGVQTESLNNKQSEEGKLIKTISGADASTTLKVKLTAPGQVVKIYKIADYSYSAESGYSDPAWTSYVNNWMLATEAYTVSAVDSGKAIKTAYKTPMNLASASSTTWDEFYNNMLYNQDSAKGPLNVIEYGIDVTGELEEASRTGKLPLVATKTLEAGASELSVSFENVNIGMYAVMVTGAKRYKPVIAEIKPRSTGPDHSYYIENEITAELKASDASIEKKINDKDADTITIGEKVKFTVEVSLPSLYETRATLTSTDNAYSLYIEDLMSKAYKIYDNDGSGAIDVGDFVITYEEDGETKYLPSQNVEGYYEIADYTYDKTGLVEGTDYVKLTDTLTDDQIKAYTYDFNSYAEMIAALGNPGENHFYYAVKRSAPAYTLVTPTTKKDSYDEDAACIKLNLNVAALKKMTKDGAINVEASPITLTYYATVTSDTEIASEKNYNTASIVYEGGNLSDTVKGYTYGLQVIKVDGETEGSQNVRYLAGAQFNLYKETSTYIKKSGEAGFTWKGDMSHNTEDPLAENENFNSYSKIKSNVDTYGSASDYYYYEYIAEEAGSLESYNGDTAVTYVAGDTIGRVFEVFTNGYIDSETSYTGKNFVSNGNADGITIKGLDEGNYVLMEAKAPIGYTELAEDVMFSVKLLSGEQLTLENQGSFAKFLDQEDTLVESGITSIRVLNYRGLTLPSTGGKGVMIFAFIGIGMMLAVLLVVLLRRRDSSYYM